MPKVDCIVPCYNDADTVVRAVSSILAQEDVDIRVFVINDGSSDDSQERLSRLDDCRLQVVSQVNKGVSAARNCGIERSEAEYCAFLDADDMWLPGKLKLQIDALASAPSNVAGHCVSFRQIRPGGRCEDRLMPAAGAFANALGGACMTSIGSTLLVRRQTFATVGYFDTALSCFEDWDWQMRCLLHGLRFDTSSSILVEKYECDHRRSGQSVEKGCARMRQHAVAVGEMFGWVTETRLRSALDFEMAVSKFTDEKPLQGTGYLLRSLLRDPSRLSFLVNRIYRRWVVSRSQ